MKSFFNRIRGGLWKLRSLPQSVWFNFHYLPFCQAIKLPIILYKPKLWLCKGSIVINAKEIKRGMITLGENTVSLCPNTGISFWCDKGGRIEFNGSCEIGNNSAIEVGSTGRVVFGDHFVATATLRLTSYNAITFEDYVVFGWDCTIMDTDFHKLTKVGGGYSRGYGSIHIGCRNWFGTGTLVMKNTRTPDYCVIAARSVLNKYYDFPPYSVIGPSHEMVVKKQGRWLNVEDDIIEYESDGSTLSS